MNSGLHKFLGGTGAGAALNWLADARQKGEMPMKEM